VGILAEISVNSLGRDFFANLLFFSLCYKIFLESAGALIIYSKDSITFKNLICYISVHLDLSSNNIYRLIERFILNLLSNIVDRIS